MLRVRTYVAGLIATLLLAVPCVVRAADSNQEQLDKLQKDLEEIRRELNAPPPTMRSNVEKALDNKYGPNAEVKTRTGKLTISGLLQVWYYDIQNDKRGLFDDPNGTGIRDANGTADNSSFQIRRAELKFTMDLHENITAVVMIDPAREATSFPLYYDNKAASLGQDSIFKRVNQIAPEFQAANQIPGSSTNVAAVQSGAGAVPRLLQDAYINYHGILPHHDVQVGQFKPFIGEEGIRNDGQLDFIERSYVGVIQDNRDMGLNVHGTWWDDRFQYWLGLYDGPANFYLSGGQTQNRSDDNSDKDFAYRVMVRPLWKPDSWGKLELGTSEQLGKHGKGGNLDPISDPLNGLNRKYTWAYKYDAWAYFAPGSVVKGWWMRGEWELIHDRNAPQSIIDMNGNGNTDDGNIATGTSVQTNPSPFTSQGFYLATGYKLSDSYFNNDCNCGGIPGWAKPIELAFRYNVFQNVQVADLIRNNRTELYQTQVWTAGLNYYISGQNAKLQFNYNWANNPEGNPAIAGRNFHNVHNDSFAVNFQVMF